MAGSQPVQSPAEPGPEGRQAAFSRYVLPEVEVLLRVAGTLTRRAPDAEDLVQDTLLRAYRGIDGFDGAHPRAWLLTIMRNAQANRTRRRRPELLDDPERDLDRAGAADGGASPETLVVGRAFDAVVAEALDALPDAHRAVVCLVDMDGLSYGEAAEALGVPVGTVMSRLHRARRRIRSRLVAAGLAPGRRP